MPELSVLVDVEDRTGEVKAAHLRRVVGLMPDNETVVVAAMVAGAGQAKTETAYTLAEAVEIAEACLSGERRALTTPGLARILSSAVAILFRVSLSRGGLQPLGPGNHDERHAGFLHDQLEAGGDEGGGD